MDGCRLREDGKSATWYQKLRYEENYDYLADPRRRTTLWEHLKCIPLALIPNSFLSLGGEIRERYEYTRNPVSGEDPQDKRGVFLQRYNVCADLHLGKYIRLFSELNSALANGRAAKKSFSVPAGWWTFAKVRTCAASSTAFVLF